MPNESKFTISNKKPLYRKGVGLPQQTVVEIFPKDYGFIEQSDKQWFLCYSGRRPAKAKIIAEAEEQEIWEHQSLSIEQQDIPRFFISLKQMGIVDSDDQIGFAVGYKGKLISKVDVPLTSVLFPLLVEVSNIITYSNMDAAQRDLAEFKKLVNDLEIT